ncbi:MAG: prepilin-type N-terminal cleavage/methylation domain-containing protein [Candidatus Vogelbacteria bacterium]|nr:prepilin-type N-terminal cleavage/methylation domain-containing protein [Candidatus Vogelbacteria bacterium]
MLKDKNKKNGFTLVEMMVSVSLFVIVAMVVSVAFVTLANIYRKIQSNRAVVDNINFMMDTISYELREGTDWRVGLECGNGKPNCYTDISFDRFGGSSPVEQVTYKINDAKKTVDQCIGNSQTCVALNSLEVTIDTFEIYTDISQSVPKATIVIHGVAQATPKIRTDFTLQSSVSLRNRSI